MGILDSLFKGAGTVPKYNEAVNHYRNLRYLMTPEHNEQYKEELLEIIRLCQIAIELDRKNGDALVLLADVLAKAAREAFRDAMQSAAREAFEDSPESPYRGREPYDYFLGRAGAVIQHCASSGLWLKEVETAEQVYALIRLRIADAMGHYDDPESWEVGEQMEAYRKTLLSNVLDSASLPTMRQMLTSRMEVVTDSSLRVG